MSAYTQALAASVGKLEGWRDLRFFTDGTFQRTVIAALETEDDILPPPDQVFRALHYLPPQNVRVVILGQDPYPTPGHAHGLAFSVDRKVRPLPRSLNNIFKELEDDLGASPAHGDLSHWADQGVLLLNTALTVAAGKAGSHARIGWAALTDQIVAELASRNGLVWVLWGNQAQAFHPWIESGSGKNRLIIESAHPSPLSARRGFFGSKPFSRINAHLAKRGAAPIEWVA